MLGDEANKIVEQRLSSPFRQLMLLGQTGRQVLESDWASGQFRLSCHELSLSLCEGPKIKDRYDSRTNEKLGVHADHRGEGRPWQSVDLLLLAKSELSTGPELRQSPENVQLPGVPSDVGCSAMGDRVAGAPQAVVQFAPKPSAKPEAGDPLDRAAQAVLGLLHRAAADAEANYRQAVDKTHQLSAQLRAAEERIRELEAHARHSQERAEWAERWLHQISVEIEQKFFGRTEARFSQPPPPGTLLRSQRR
jgi:hypothetical protein